MNPQHSKIMGLVASLKKAKEEYVRNSGMGYCACASVDLKAQLGECGIEGKLIYGKHLSDNHAGNKAKSHFKNLIANFPIGHDFHGRVKRAFVKNGNKLSDKGGHVGVLVNDTVYDVTSAQFGLPVTYPLKGFLGMWDTALIVDIKLKNPPTSWNQTVCYSYKAKMEKGVAQESIGEEVHYALEAYAQEDDTDKEDFYRWYATQSKETQTNSKIVSSEDIGQDYMLHIDKTTPAVFVAKMPRSAAKSENDTTARITVAPTLLGCLIGYARVESDLLNGTTKEVAESIGFKGGYEICTLPFKHCLFPNEKLVYDSQQSGEHWLVSYNKETLEYKPTKVGKVFVAKMTYMPVSGKDPRVTFEMYIEVHKEDGFKFSPDLYLDKGFYRVTMEFDREKHAGSVNDQNNIKLDKIYAAEYNKSKQLSAAMLSHRDKAPKYLNW